MQEEAISTTDIEYRTDICWDVPCSLSYAFDRIRAHELDIPDFIELVNGILRIKHDEWPQETLLQNQICMAPCSQNPNHSLERKTGAREQRATRNQSGDVPRNTYQPCNVLRGLAGLWGVGNRKLPQTGTLSRW